MTVTGLVDMVIDFISPYTPYVMGYALVGLIMFALFKVIGSHNSE